MNMDFKRKLPIPKDVKEEFPLSEKMEQVKAACLRVIAEN